MKIKNLQVIKNTYNSSIKVLDEVNLDFSAKVNVVYGEPGSGKSTLMETIAGLEKANSGEISFEGNVILFMQVPERQFLYSTCEMEVASNGNSREEVMDLLAAAGLPEDILEISPWYLSSGEKKRLNLARIMNRDIVADSNNIFLLDDPFGDLDEKGKEIFLEKIIKGNKYKIIITLSDLHDLEYLEKNNIEFKLYKLCGGKVVN